MKELKFKLKRGGVCVGYERRKRTAKGNRMTLQHRKPDGPWKDIATGSGAALNGWIDHDEMCPLVCQDRNGLDVYEGDAAKLAFEQRFGPVKGSCILMWDCPEHGISIPPCDESIVWVELLDPQPTGDQS